jgi:hypothetical protein
LTIDKSVTLNAPVGVYAAVTAVGNTAIRIAVSATDTVVLRGLTVIGRNASRGIEITSGGTVHIENCVIRGFSTGPPDEPGGIFSNSPTAFVFVKDSTLSDNADGVRLQDGAKGSVANSRLDHNSETTWCVATQPM